MAKSDMDNGLAKHTYVLSVFEITYRLRQAVWMDPSRMNTARRSPAGSLRSLRSIIKARGAPSFVDSSDYDHKVTLIPQI